MNTTIEITPKREKAVLAFAYCTTAISGLVFWNVKDAPKTTVGTTFVDDGYGRSVASVKPNASYWASTSIFVASIVFLLAVKIRIWWRHY